MPMTREELIQRCTAELWGGPAFLETYHDALMELFADTGFVNQVGNIYVQIGPNEFKDLEFSKNHVLQSMAMLRLYEHYALVREIVTASKQEDLSGSLGYLSIYFAWRIYNMKGAVRANEKLAGQRFGRQKEETRPAGGTDCEDGHPADSPAHREIDNWLYRRGVCHGIKTEVAGFASDFFIPGKSLYLEYAASPSPGYTERLRYYKTQGIAFTEITEADLADLDRVLGGLFSGE